MWNDTDVPLAFLITFRCRGTWLHGDVRGSVDRSNNKYGTPKIPQNAKWAKHNRSTLKIVPVYLDAARRRSVEVAIRETCRIRGWLLYALNVRTNHVHLVVVVGSLAPGKVLHALKSNATRQMRADACWAENGSPWVDHGSRRYLWNDNSVAAAIDYVLYGQGDDLPDFD